MPKIIQDRTRCIGCFACVGLAPEYFAPDETTGLAKLLDSQSTGEVFTREVPTSDAVATLPAACCGGAISLEE